MRAFITGIIVLLSFIGPFVYAGGPGEEHIFSFTSPNDFSVGEHLKYAVKYSYLNLGTIEIRVVAKTSIQGKKHYKAKATMDSHKGIGLVSLHQVFESTFAQDCASAFFRGLDKKENAEFYTDYTFNRASGSVLIKKGKVSPPEVYTSETRSLDTVMLDGLSLFFYARAWSGSDKSVRVPVFIVEKKGFTLLQFSSKKEKIEIDAIDYPVAVNRLSGKNEFVSILGLTGKFEGWFSADDAAIPIAANLKIDLGSIRIELKEWKRNGWNPPKY